MEEMVMELNTRLTEIADKVSGLEEILYDLAALRDEIHHIYPNIEEYMTSEQENALDCFGDLWEYIVDRDLENIICSI